MTRRLFLKQAALALALGEFLRLKARAGVATSAHAASADACILLFLNGGMSHLDTVDPKPAQPDEIRGEFGVIRTSVPGTFFTEHVPRWAGQAHRLAVIRSVGFEGRLANHSPACYHLLTGVEPEGEAALLAPPRPSDHPSMGSAAAFLRPAHASLPSYVMAPDVLIENAHLTPGQFAGWLGSPCEAFNVRGDPNLPTYAIPDLTRGAELTHSRMAERRTLLGQLNAGRPDLAQSVAGRRLDPFHARAFDLLSGSRAQAAFDITREAAAVRDRYGRHVVGQSLLLARRLVEAGVRFVNVHWPNVGGGRNWDTHANGFNRLKDDLLPPTDRGVAALVEDLADRGMLERTLVLVLTEFGRAPQIGRTFQNAGGAAGRDHWSSCFSLILAGGGVRGGAIYGRSNARGEYPSEHPVTPADVVATVYRALGIDPQVILRDPEGRTHRLCTGAPIGGLFWTE